MHVCHANTCTYMHTHNLSLKSPQSATGSSFRNFLKWGGIIVCREVCGTVHMREKKEGPGIHCLRNRGQLIGGTYYELSQQFLVG